MKAGLSLLFLVRKGDVIIHPLPPFRRFVLKWFTRFDEERSRRAVTPCALRATCTSLAGRYAYALFEVALSKGTLEQTLAECCSLLELFSLRSPHRLLVTNALRGKYPQGWTQSFEQSLGVQDFVLNFLRLLALRGRLPLFRDILRLLRRLVDEHFNREALTVTSVVPLSESQKEALVQRLRRYFQKELLVSYEVRPSVLGGFIVKGNTVTLDASARHFISQFVQEAQKAFTQLQVKEAI